MFTTLCDVHSSSFLVNFLVISSWGLTYILHVVIGLYVREKPRVCGVQYCLGCWLPWGSWDMSPQVREGTCHVILLPQSWLAAFVT